VKWILVFGVIFAVNLLVESNVHASWVDDWAKMARIKPKHYICYRTSGDIRVDGRLDESSWYDVPWTDDFRDIEGDIKPIPRFRTRAKMLWDDKYFYVGAELEEPHVWATLTEHDSIIFHDNDFEIFIDPDGDNHGYYEIEINAFGTEWDLLLIKPYKDGGPAVHSWEIPGLKVGVDVKGTINDPGDEDEGWSVEVAIPFDVLKECARGSVPPSHGSQWRVNFSRVEWNVEIAEGQYKKVAGKREDNWVWSPQGVIDMHRPEKWGYVQFSTDEVAKAEFKPDPLAKERNLLLNIYYAQKDYRKEHGKWAKNLAELSIDGSLYEGKLKPHLETTESCFEASVISESQDREPVKLHILHDSRIWVDGN
jgi:hypothetical protein